MIRMLLGVYDAVFTVVQNVLSDMVMGLFMRFVFASTLLFYFWNSALTKVINVRKGAEGPLDYLTVEGNALAQIAPKAFEAAGYDPSAVSSFYWIIAYAGTYAEFILPLLIVLGLFTRAASLGMIGFIAVMTFVDVTGHASVKFELSKMFDNLPTDLLVDQRLFWLAPLLYLIARGAGFISLDRLVLNIK